MSQADFVSPWPRVSVVMPTLNEARNLPYVFLRLPEDVYEVIVVDGQSVDGTTAVARQLRADVRIVQQTRTGKGNALACGFAVATGDVIAMVDADGSADPSEIPKFVQALLSGADFAKGTRFAPGGGSNDITRVRKLGNRVLCSLVNICYRTHYSDLCYGFNVFWRKHVPVLGLDIATPPASKGDGRLWGDGFEIETLIHMRIAAEGLYVTEVPSFERSRIHGVSNLDAVSDGLRVLATILAERRRARDRARRRAHQVAADIGLASDTRLAPAPDRELIPGPTPRVRKRYVLHFSRHRRPGVHRAGPPAVRTRIAVRSGSGRHQTTTARRRETTEVQQVPAEDLNTGTQLLRGE